MQTPVWEIEPTTLDRPLLVHVNATATGGGVSELIRGLLRHQPAGWAVIAGNPAFYEVTKYLHLLLHGHADPTVLDDPETMRVYRSALAPQTRWFAERLRPGDVAVLHDPQTLGLAPALRAAGVRVVWHCHIGAVVAPERGPGAFWRAFRAELVALDAVVTTLPEFAPPNVRELFVVTPAVDPEALKNRELAADEVASVLATAGLTADGGTAGVTVVQERPLPPDARVVLQVSRWDPLKDMPGVVRCVVGLPADVHLVLAGTDPADIADDPDGLAVFEEVRRLLAELPAHDRARVHLVTLSLTRPDLNALVVNALQRRADVVLQKSLEEGFGLTVTEAMVKGRPVVASAVGGLRHQVTDGHNGLLVDPVDLPAVRAALVRLLDDPELGRTLGERARRTVLERYTMRRLAEDYLKIVGTPSGR
ncbi:MULTISPECIES: glycosyltransferase [unclassified Micromonospora]|uniref:glycosyltransferase n=1 Tax=unclassified Micromonospora TaxID=2617518 RepID=UPI001B39A6E0|nr:MULTISPECIES: glycosyltransferase [unclassified Micromonospora]MBQ1044355.1 glycosyltransferase [Micromonospora sp. C72]MBQ1056859.1 glycosyltransferase [Micromonospora sp. C32]